METDVNRSNTSPDTYIKDHLPAVGAWPTFINADVAPDVSGTNSAYAFLDRAVAEGSGRKIAIHTPDSQWTYEELLGKANQIAHVLSDEFNLVPGERVLLRAPNNPMLAACWFGVLKAGGIVVCTMPMLRAKELRSIIDIANVSVALCDARVKDEFDKAIDGRGLRTVSYFNGVENADTDTSLEGRMAEKPLAFENRPCEKDTIALLLFTSGTTGKPKAAAHSHHALLAVCETFSRQVVQPEPDDVFVCTAPIAFAYGLGAALLFPLYARASTLLLEDARPQSLGVIDQFAVTILFTAPTAYKKLLEDNALSLGSLRRCISAGEALPAYVSTAWLEKTGLRIIDGIGSTEMLHIFLSVDGPDTPMGSLGKAVPGYEARVVDASGNDLPIGEPGFLAVRGPTGCRYVSDPRQTRYVIDGWNHTGDTVRVDGGGYFWYLSRSDDLIVSSGYKIAAPDVEAVVSQHAAVAECAVIGVPDPGRGNIVRAYIVLGDGFAPSEELVKDIQDFAKQEGAPYKYPRSIKFIDALPRTPTGKIKHFALREAAKAEG